MPIITAVQGDITKQDVDAVVNAAAVETIAATPTRVETSILVAFGEDAYRQIRDCLCAHA